MRLISAQALKDKLDHGDPLKLVNALGEWEYRAAHIPGSLHFATPEETLRELGRDDEIVVHCSNPSCMASVALYQLLERNGYRNLRRFAGGLQEWQEAGYPLEGTMVESHGDSPGPEQPRRRHAGHDHHPLSRVVRHSNLGTIELNFYKRTGRDAMGPIVEDLTPPVDLDRDHWRGGERAAVTLVEYGDYECPYSRMAFRNIQRLEQQLAGQLRFVFRQLPLTGIHPHALAAAHLAEAAALQGRFWPMHELLFHRQQALEDSDLLGYADQLGLDRHQLLADLDGQTVRQRVQADADSALASGARGTPTLFINGRLQVAGYDEATLGAALAAASKEA